MKMMNAWLALVLLAAAPVAASAQAGVDEVRQSIEASMLVNGVIEVDAEGRVVRFELYQRPKIPATVLELIDEAVPAWRFEPTIVDGTPVGVRTQMRLRVAASKAPDDPGVFLARVAGASFGGHGSDVRRKSLRPPNYPRELVDRGIQGTVFLLLKIGRTGNVEDVVAEQVNLQLISGERDMRTIRTKLARAATKAARGWTFVPPTDGDEADDPFWSVRVPIEFMLADVAQPGYGEWTAYVPGPRTVPEWIEDDTVGADSFAANEIYLVGKGPRLLTQLGGID